MAKVSFRQQMLQVREDAIVASVNRLLAEKGFDMMTVDEVAADVGIAKASLYKHFASKEALAAAAMVRVLQAASDVVDQQAARTDADAYERLREVTRWALQRQLAGEMPTLPSQNSSLRAELMADKAYIDLLMQVSERLGEWIVAAQAEGRIDRSLPFIRREGLRIITEKEYASHAEAREGIAAAVQAFYAQNYADLAGTPAVEQAGKALGDAYAWNNFPHMKVKWNTYKNHIGHQESPGCFRCHDNKHKTDDGEKIGKKCSTCHNIVAEEESNSQVLQELGLQEAPAAPTPEEPAADTTASSAGVETPAAGA
jgi:AcrR family transcriptional regulator/DNA-directed RNA polymerase subunit N (RpoN/RPB10)